MVLLASVAYLLRSAFSGALVYSAHAPDSQKTPSLHQETGEMNHLDDLNVAPPNVRRCSNNKLSRLYTEFYQITRRNHAQDWMDLSP